MADIVLSAFLTVVFEKMASEPLKKIARSKRIDSELKKLERSLGDIQALLNDASRKEVSNEAVRRWLNRLQHLAYDIDDLLDGLATDAIHRELTGAGGGSTSMVKKLIPSCCNNFSQSSAMHAKLDDIATELQELVEAKNNLGLNVITYEKPKVERNEASLVNESDIVGRESEKKRLVGKLLGERGESSSQNFSIVPIVGMGGVGKTTLARLLYDYKEVKLHFQVRAWVCVSDDFNITNISKVIYQSVTGENKEFASLNLLQEALKEKLQNKLFLIVLDDVWSESYGDWEKLVGPFLAGSPGSKIIMTTRKKQLLTQLGFSHQDQLQHLSEDDALTLFAQHALGADNFDSHPTLRPHGEEFVRKCGCLPLALRTLGRLLRTKENEEDWKELLDSEIWKLGEKDDTIPAVRLSYLDLSSSLKLLFAYCSLFPNDYEFDKDDLILLWMAEGFLHQSSTSTSMGRLGHTYFEELLSRSFFQNAPNDKSLFVMHDLMNDLATSVAGDFFARFDIEMKKEFRKEAFGKHRHMSLVCEDYIVQKRLEPFRGAKSLRTFLALSVGVVESWKTFYLSNKVLNDILQNLPLLRVLSLSHLNISEVPEAVGSMKHLRYLNLSGTAIKYLPEAVCNLYNLQTLIVSGCEELIKLPESFSKLKSLQHFDMRVTRNLKKMPLGIGDLKSLQTLFNTGSDSLLAINELKKLQNLHGKVSMLGLGNVENAREANLSQKEFSELELDWGDEFNDLRMETYEKEVLNELKPHSGTLEKLRIKSYRGMEFPNWVGDSSFLKLTHVEIYGCEECTSLPRLGQLPSLKELVIHKMSKVKVVGLELSGSGVAFPSLQILRFEDMSGWEEWSMTNSVVVDAAFPCLQELLLRNCPNLVQISLEALPALRALKVTKVGHGVLTSLVRVASSATKLEIDDISGLTDELWRVVMKNLGKVEEVRIERCNEIRYLWESEAEASKVLVNLRELRVSKCSELVRLGEKEEDDCGSKLTSLRLLVLEDCNSLEHCSCPDGIESLTIYDCDSIESVSFPTVGGGQNLTSLRILGCEKMLETELGGREKTGVLINSHMQLLKTLSISHFPYLKRINELSCFIHLTSLVITACPGMESFPDHELPNLTSLKQLQIVSCKSMDASFPRGLWPPKLQLLTIGGLKKPISEWGPQNFPTSLEDLRLHGRPSEDVGDFIKLSHLLPTSLTRLWINGFEKVESVSSGLQHLTSLQKLYIFDCPKARDLPDMLFPSLLSLRIYGCPNLKEKISKGGSYYTLISHIPCFDTFE